jgi:hypothetical protein
MGWKDVFPFETLGAFASLLGLVPTTGVVNDFTGVGTVTIESRFVSGVDLSCQLLGFAEGLDFGVLGEGRRDVYQYQACDTYYDPPVSMA